VKVGKGITVYPEISLAQNKSTAIININNKITYWDSQQAPHPQRSLKGEGAPAV
jgi:hypothetical protein